MAVISIDKRKLVISLQKEGHPQRLIARKFKIFLCAAQNRIKKHLQGFSVENKLKSGCRNILSCREQRKVVIESKRNPFYTASEVQSADHLSNAVSL